MKKAGRRIWAWILSGLALLLGSNSCFRIPTAKVYGPPPKETLNPPTSEKLYGPPIPEVERDTI